MPRKPVPIKTLLLRTFLPAVVVVAMLLAALVYNLLYTSILDGFDRKLITTSSLTGAMIDPADHDRLIQIAHDGGDPEVVERTITYRRNTDPIRRIRERLGLTYLYTQVIGGPSDVLYILDGSEGDDHSPIGYEDDLPDDTMAGLARVEKEKSIYVSPIEYQDEWGLLKTAAAPILGSRGGTSGSAGADVNISVIQVATQNALFASAMIGIGSILVCLMVALVLVRQIAAPIEVLTEDTLRIAAGDRRKPADVKGPREVGRLREALGRLAEKMSSHADHRSALMSEHEDKARLDLLRQAGAQSANAPRQIVDSDGLLVAWIPGSGSEAETLLAARSMDLLARRISAKPELARNWPELADTKNGDVIVVDATAGTVELAGSIARTVIVAGEEITLEPGQSRKVDAVTPLAVKNSDGSVQELRGAKS